MDDNPKPDGFEKCLRFGCGTLFGGAVMFLAISQVFFSTSGFFWILLGISALVCGLLAIRYGDSFYRGILDFFQRW